MATAQFPGKSVDLKPADLIDYYIFVDVNVVTDMIV